MITGASEIILPEETEVPAVLYIAGQSSDTPRVQFGGDGAQNGLKGGFSETEDEMYKQISTVSGTIPLRGDDDTNINEESFTVEKAVEQLGFGKFQYLLSLLCGLAWVVDAMEVMILAIMSPYLLCHWRLSSTQEAFITVTVFLGMMAFSSFWGIVSDKYGRKFGLMFSSAFTFYFGVMTAFSPNYAWVLVLRGLTGAGVAGACQAVTIYSEFLPGAYRARSIVLLEVFWAIGTVFAVGIAVVVMPSLGWRYLVLFCSFPLGVFIILCYWLPESVRFLVVSGEKEEAMRIIKQIARVNGKPMPLGQLVADDDGSKERGKFADLFSSSYTLTTILLWILWFVCAISYYGIVLVTTEVFQQLGNADAKCVSEAQNQAEDQHCWAECEPLDRQDYIDTLWTTIAEFPGFVIAMVLVDLLGRKKAMAVQFFFFALFIYSVSFCMSRGAVTAAMFVARAFIVAAFQTVYVYTCEVYPTTIRALGMGSGSGMSRVGAMVTPFIAQVLLKENISLAMAIYALFSLLATVCALVLPIETRGREMKSV